MELEEIEIENLRQIKYIKEELLDILSFLNDFIEKNSEKQKAVYYESIIRHKIDRVCNGIPNFILSPEVFKLVKEIFMKAINLKEKKNQTNEAGKRINEIYGRFKYLIEWCLIYYEETFININN